MACTRQCLLGMFRVTGTYFACSFGPPKKSLPPLQNFTLRLLQRHFIPDIDLYVGVHLSFFVSRDKALESPNLLSRKALLRAHDWCVWRILSSGARNVELLTKTSESNVTQHTSRLIWFGLPPPFPVCPPHTPY